MDKKVLKKIIKNYFTAFAKQYDFVFYKSTMLLRVRDDTLHIINFDLIGDGLYCNIAIQPLYILSDDISLSFGNRLNHFKTKSPGIWGYSDDKNAIERDLSQIKYLIEVNAIPWFNDYGTPIGIISFIESGLSEDINVIVGFPPALRSIYLGFSYLYTNKLSFAEKVLMEVVEQSKEDKREWVIQQNEMINSVIFLSKNEPSKIDEKLNEYIRITKANLRIKV